MHGCSAAPPLQARPTSYPAVLEALRRKHRNVNMVPAKHANYARLYALCSAVWHADAVAAELEAGVTLEEVQVGLGL